jgi:TrmH family RNA methyltransferase
VVTSGVPATPFKLISSASNELFRAWDDCLSGKGIRKHGLFIVAGHRAIEESLKRWPILATHIILREGRNAERLEPSIESLVAKISSLQMTHLSGALFDRLNTAGTPGPLLVMKTPELKQTNFAAPAQGIEILCALGDPANVGALLRSAAAIGASKVILLKESATPFHPKAVRAASAATLLTPLELGPSIGEVADYARTGGNKSWIALDMSGTDVFDFTWPENLRLLIGEEGKGVPSPANFKCLSIPMRNSVESLNASVAASLAMFSYRQAQK